MDGERAGEDAPVGNAYTIRPGAANPVRAYPQPAGMMGDAYARCTTLTRDQWAWEFLRRNPGYQADYRRFISIWHALEAEYGAPPNRDFTRWKRDPRAYGPLPGDVGLGTTSGELCTVEDERVLLECWLGAKWGFYKFPLDPACSAPPPDALSWRPAPAAPHIDDTYRLDISFDLSLPLSPQLEAARVRLATRSAALRRQGLAAPMTVANQRARWTRMLRLLDAPPDSPASDVDPALRQDAEAMVHGGYLQIPLLPDPHADTG